MGMYAQTHFTIECDTRETAKRVVEALSGMKEDQHGNRFALDAGLKITPYENPNKGAEVEGFMSSGRIQNLEYQVGAVLGVVKKIKGVEKFDAPFLTEAESIYWEEGDE